jgi:hypothetical protein
VSSKQTSKARASIHSNDDGTIISIYMMVYTSILFFIIKNSIPWYIIKVWERKKLCRDHSVKKQQIMESVNVTPAEKRERQKHSTAAATRHHRAHFFAVDGAVTTKYNQPKPSIKSQEFIIQHTHMPRKHTSITASELRDKLVSRLGIATADVDDGGRKKKPKKQLTRKERRKLERSTKKMKVVATKSSRHQQQQQEEDGRIQKDDMKKYETGLKRKTEDIERRKDQSAKKMKKTPKVVNDEVIDEGVSDPEDIEIRRLEKLLGLSKEAKMKAAKKLDKVDLPPYLSSYQSTYPFLSLFVTNFKFLI